MANPQKKKFAPERGRRSGGDALILQAEEGRADDANARGELHKGKKMKKFFGVQGV